MLDEMPIPPTHFNFHFHIDGEMMMMKEESCSGDGVALNNCSFYSHAADRVPSCPERLLVCEACEGAPAALLCKADAALLCTTCDADIHSANPLARRHHRVPIYAAPPGTAETEFVTTQKEAEEEDEEEEAASWLLLNPVKTTTTTTTTTNNNNQNSNNNNGVLFNSGEGEEYLDVFKYNSIGDSYRFSEQYNHDDDKEEQKSYCVAPQKSGYGGDSVVPVQCGEAKDGLQQQQQLKFQLGLEYEPSKMFSFNGSFSPSVRLSFKLIYSS